MLENLNPSETPAPPVQRKDWGTRMLNGARTTLTAARITLATAGVVSGVAVATPSIIKANAAIKKIVITTDLQDFPTTEDLLRTAAGVELAVAGAVLGVSGKRRKSPQQRPGDDSTGEERAR